MDNPQISLIVPVYNVEQYLSGCIDSILAQTFTNFEVLLIDDGSTDSSGGICEEYSEKDNRIRVFYKENGGVSSARNIGLQEAKGKYICFVDSDDSIRTNYLLTMLSLAESTHADMVVESACYFIKQRNLIKPLLLQDKTYKRMQFGQMLCDMRRKGLFGVPWNKLFKTDIIRSRNLLFDLDLDSYEDEVFNLQYLQYSKKVVTSSIIVYDYISRTNDSLSQRYIEISKHLKIASFIFQLESLLPHDKISMEEMKINYMEHYANCIVWQYSRIHKMPRLQRLINISEIKQNVPTEYRQYFLSACRRKRIYFRNKYFIDTSMFMLIWLKKLLHRIY